MTAPPPLPILFEDSYPMFAEPEAHLCQQPIEAFAEEALERLDQLHVALDELQQEPPADRSRILIQTILTGIGAIVGAAAAIGLSEVERAGASAIPFVEAVQVPASRPDADRFFALCKRLGDLRSALISAKGQALPISPLADHARDEPVHLSTSDVLAALYRFQESRACPPSSGRNLLSAMIEHLEGLRKNGIERCTVASIRALLDRWAERDAEFVEVARIQIPAVIEAIEQLKSEAQDLSRSPERFRPILEQAAQLMWCAQQAQAPQAEFFTGLHGFLSILSQRRVAVTVSKYEAVKSRLREYLQALEAWQEAGREERSAISGVFTGEAWKTASLR